jgi:hypothetical protein
MYTIAPEDAAEHASIDTGALKKVAQEARRVLRDQVSAKLALVLAEGSAARREAPKAVKELEGEIERTSRDQILERIAYIWFNRFTALRFMDANGYTKVHAVTPAIGQTRPEILSEAMAGIIGDEVPKTTAAQVRALLDNRTPSQDPQGEAYRLLLVATCNHWHAAMPFMFETIADYTELLMPEDLLSQGSMLAKVRAVMTEDACQDVEIIGWLYQFYISERKDEVFAGLKKNVKITPENIPAATQLFTPHWIVRYLVENSLGRLWLLNRPQSKLAGKMDYYLAPEEPETDFLRVTSPEEIRICDPACGSGHMLTYAFDLLHAIYEEEGYDAAEIPGLILTHNLYGIEIDERAGALAAFAVTMKAAARRKRFLRRGIKPNICVLDNVVFKGRELDDYIAMFGRNLFTADLIETLGQFVEAKNFGSLIVPKLKDVTEVARVIAAHNFADNLFLRDVHARVQAALQMAEYLSQKYHVVVANPPYMGSGGMNDRLKRGIAKDFKFGKSDLMTAFMQRCLGLTRKSGMVAMVTMDGWMFLSSFEDLRQELLTRAPIISMAHVGWNCFPDGHTYNRGTAFVFRETKSHIVGLYLNLANVPAAIDKEELFHSRKRDPKQVYFRSPDELRKIPGSPLAYWAPRQLFEVFSNNPSFSNFLEPREGLTTGSNATYVRFSWEVSRARVGRNLNGRSDELIAAGKKWFPYNKGGDYRKWYGNDLFVVDWEDNGKRLQETLHPEGHRIWAHNFNLDFIFRPSVSWSDVTSRGLSARLFPEGFIFDATGLSAFNRTSTESRLKAAAICNSAVGLYLAPMLNPTLHFKSGDFAEMPFIENVADYDEGAVKRTVELAQCDWDAYESSWDFSTQPLLDPAYRRTTLAETYTQLRAHWGEMIKEMQQLEEENNRIFIAAYGLQDELISKVPLEDITLTCNPAYCYGGKKSEAELEVLLLADTMREFVSFAVGCMFGRYSPDAPGLILANQGEGLENYLAKVPNPTFEPDADNVIPVLDGDWFADDIAARFRKFLRVTFGDERFQENLAFLEEALGKDIRKYFTRDFFNDHVKRYRKRPIYWLFSSPRGTFNALIYMHRYRADTVSVVLNDYLREFRSKLVAHRRAQQALSISGDASPAQKTKALKEIEATGKQIEELDVWERDVLFPLATQKIEIDLDDGVKANYPKFGAALKPIKGLNDADD